MSTSAEPPASTSAKENKAVTSLNRATYGHWLGRPLCRPERGEGFPTQSLRQIHATDAGNFSLPVPLFELS